MMSNILFIEFYGSAVFCDNVQTDQTPYKAEFLCFGSTVRPGGSLKKIMLSSAEHEIFPVYKC